MKAFLKWLILVPLALLLIAFAFANHQIVTVSFDPFSTDMPAFALSGPLFVVMILAVVTGVVIGSLATWLGQGHHRRTARQSRREADALRGETDQARAELEQARAELAATQTRQPHDVYGSFPALPGQTAA